MNLKQFWRTYQGARIVLGASRWESLGMAWRRSRGKPASIAPAYNVEPDIIRKPK